MKFKLKHNSPEKFVNISDDKEPYSTILYGAIKDPTGPYGNIQNYAGQDNTGPYGTIQDHMRLYKQGNAGTYGTILVQRGP